MGQEAVKSRDLSVFVSGNPRAELCDIYFMEVKAKRVVIFNMRQENVSGKETSVPNY